MEDAELQKKLDEMQIYLPFLEKVIKKLRHSSCEKSDNLKDVQLNKLEVLNDLLTKKRKKLNLDTLLKCENVLTKLHQKVEQDGNYDSISLEEIGKVQSTEMDNSSKYLYPESPPPTEKTETRFSSPMEIPTERRDSPFSRGRNDKPYKHRAYNTIKPADVGERSSFGRRDNNEYRSYQGYRGKHDYLTKYDHPNKSEYRPKSDCINYKNFKEKHRNFGFGRRETNDKRYSRNNKEYVPEQSVTKLRTDIKENEFKAKSVFYRLGDKLSNHIPRNKSSTTEVIVQRTITQQVTISSKSKISSIEDVLKSPPLTESDISELLQENSLVETCPTSNNNTDLNNLPKNSEKQDYKTRELSKFEMVRKKFALIAKSSPELNSDNSVDLNSAIEKNRNVPSSSTSFADQLIHTFRQKKQNCEIFENLKTQDPRIQRQNQSYKDLTSFEIGSVKPADSMAFRNNLDPRLRRIETTSYFNERSEMNMAFNRDSYIQRTQTQSERSLDQKNIYNSKLNLEQKNIYNSEHISDIYEQNSSQKLRVQQQGCKTDSYVSCSNDNNTGTNDKHWNSSYSSYRKHTDVNDDLSCLSLGHNNSFSPKRNSGSNVQTKNKQKLNILHPSTQDISADRSRYLKTARIHNFDPSKESDDDDEVHKTYYGEDKHSGISKFNAELNDKSERNKYLESKKQKQQKECSQTYAEYKRAKARAAALETDKEIAVTTSDTDVSLKNETFSKPKQEEYKKVELKPDNVIQTEIQPKSNELKENPCADFENKSEKKSEILKKTSSNVNMDEQFRKITNDEINKLPNFQPNRLIKRRNSMVEYGSEAEVEKNVLQYANTILYADIQCQERILNKKLNILDKGSNRNSESLINIFKKTDDNCTVSTQNIVSGKRKTRANVNFNEVHQTQTVFRHKQNGLEKPKKKSNPSSHNTNGKIKPAPDENFLHQSKNSIQSDKTTSENGNQEVINGIVQDILNPNDNTVYILGLLENILSADQLRKVKSVIQSVQDPSDCSIANKSDAEKSQKKHFKKHNKLNRLKNDLLNMFISDGLLNSAGREICKLVADSYEMKSNSDDQNKANVQENLKLKKEKCKVNTSTVPIANHFDNDNLEIKPQFKQRKLTVKLAKIKNFKTLPKQSLRAEKDVKDSFAKLSKANTAVLYESIQQKTDAEIKTEIEFEKNEDKFTIKMEKRSRQEILETDKIRNTNIEWHSLSKYAEKCVICHKKMQFLAAHYSVLHAEHYTSRLATTVVKKLQEGNLGEAILRKKRGGAGGGSYVYFHRCPLCLQYASKSIKEWAEHFIVHTAEYTYECSYCHKGASKPNLIERHIEKSCPQGKVIKKGLPYLKERVIKGYVCHLCNFVQLHRHHLNRHYIEQHELDNEAASTLGFEVILMNWARTQSVSEKRAAILERRAQKQKFLFILEETSELTTSEIKIKTEILPISSKDCQISSVSNIVHKKDEDKSFQTIDEKENCVKISVNSRKNLSTSNAFVPTSRDNDSPITEFTQKLITIQQESNLQEDRRNTFEGNESIVERLSQRLKRMESKVRDSNNSEVIENVIKGKENNLKNRKIDVSSGKHHFRVEDSDDDCWEDIESNELQKTQDGFESGTYKGKNKTNIKKLHRFYASNANRAKKIKGSYLNKKNKAFELQCSKDDKFLLCNDAVATLPPPMIIQLEDLNTYNENINLASQELRLYDTELMDNVTETLSDAVIDKQTSFNTMVQENKIPLNQQEIDVQNKVHRIWNVGFSKDNFEKYKYYCLAEHCTFLYSSESVGLESHCLSDHAAVKWHGYCDLCQNKEGIQTTKCYLSIVDEINHMLKFHVEKPFENPNASSVDSFTTQYINKRRLSEDNFSTLPKITLRSQLESTNPSEEDSHLDLSTNYHTEKTPENIHRLDYSEVSFSDLQITDVRSLTKRKSIESVPGNDATLPKIVKVCSLNPSYSLLNDSDGKLCSELVDLAETLPIDQNNEENLLIDETSYSANRIQSKQPENQKIQPHETKDCTEPPQLPHPTRLKDGERAPYRCMAKNCKYITRVAVSMIDHLHFHEVRSFLTERDFLRCNYCIYCADDKTALIAHINDVHLKLGKEVIGSIENETLHEHLSKTNNGRDIQLTKSKIRNDLKDAIKGLVSSTGKKEKDVYCCIFSNCKANLSELSFLPHVESHRLTCTQPATITYKCKHCHLKYTRLTGLKYHLKSHGVHRYFCFLCSKTAVGTAQLLKHYGEDHYRTNSLNVAKLFEPEASDTDELSYTYFVVHSSELTADEVQQFSKKLITEWQYKKKALNPTIIPNEMQELPMQPIFQKEVQCAHCAYKTKVRTNLVRHFLLHKSGAIGEQQIEVPVDPVNPMPCLNSNEKHFDKMTNLASSSLVTSNGVVDNSNNIEKISAFKITYEYVPDTKVFTCGVMDCQYLTLSEEIFRSHITTLHSDARTYTCPFCNEEVCTRGIVIERIIHHSRYHGQYLYQCKQCGYLHYIKPVVRRHIQEKHNSSKASIDIITHDRTANTGPITLTQTLLNEEDSANNTPTQIVGVGNASNKTKTESRWQCNLCSQSTKTHNQIISHCNTKHGCRHRYQCSACIFSASQMDIVNKHIETIHIGTVCTVKTIFHKEMDNTGSEQKDKPQVTQKVSVNTKPLWQRNDPQRVRHIRGILMEDEEETEQHRKRLCLDDYNDDDDDDVITIE